ncbi:hypothetical protein JX265_007516 [Neoarthrinium moseri]|uniref:Uncharacterized protein n=1 Tax=Neoarthrinium moseri TaxID=1658444 RepID=A0A9Q0AN13_9PEZI|nr:hypothetical protein JX265_007516 [Neoarthrinium moseri]
MDTKKHSGLVGSFRRKFKTLSSRASSKRSSNTSIDSLIPRRSTSTSLSDPPSVADPPAQPIKPVTLPQLEFRNDDSFKMFQTRYGLDEILTDTAAPPPIRKPVRIIKRPSEHRKELPRSDSPIPCRTDAPCNATPTSIPTSKDTWRVPIHWIDKILETSLRVRRPVFITLKQSEAPEEHPAITFATPGYDSTKPHQEDSISVVSLGKASVVDQWSEESILTDSEDKDMALRLSS